jgi:hypothetical protein
MCSVPTITPSPTADRVRCRRDAAASPALTAASAPARALPKLLVVTYFAPDTQHGGAICLSRLLDGYPDERLVWAHHEPAATDPASRWSRVEQWPIGLLPRPNRFGLDRAVKEFGNWTIHAPRMAREIAARAREAGVEAVLGIGPGISIWTSYLVAERLDVPLHLWVHDDPQAHARYRGWPWYTVARIGRCFRRAYEAAAVRYVISEPMRALYRERTGADAVLMPPSLGPLACRVPAPRRTGRLRIGFAGALAGPDAWRVFLAGLERAFGAAPRDRQPEIVAFAERVDVPIPESIARRGWVDVRGWQPESLVDETLASMDYLYFPLWFDRRRRDLVATSFSTKLVSYHRAGVPIFCHVPAASAVAEYVRRVPVGPLLDTLDVEVLAARLTEVIEHEDWHECLPSIWDRALATFDHDALRSRFHESLCGGEAVSD